MTDATRVGRGHGTRWLLLITGLGFLAAVAIWLFAAAPARLLAAEGVAAEAVVVAGGMEDGAGRAADRRILEVAFTPEGGEEVRVRGVVDAALFEATAVGDRIPIRYAASDPRVAELQPGALAGPARVTGWIALAVGLAFSAMLAAAARARRRSGGA